VHPLLKSLGTSGSWRPTYLSTVYCHRDLLYWPIGMLLDEFETRCCVFFADVDECLVYDGGRRTEDGGRGTEAASRSAATP